MVEDQTPQSGGRDVPPQRPGDGAAPPLGTGREESAPPSGAAPGYAAPGHAAATVAATPQDWLTRLLVPAHESKGWLRFLGIISILGGILTALSVVGLLFAWLYIWVGVLFWQAGDRAAQAYLQRDPSMLEQFLQKLKNLIIIAGVATAVSLAAALLFLALGFAFGWLAMIASEFGM
jgi:hypothetical protein